MKNISILKNISSFSKKIFFLLKLLPLTLKILPPKEKALLLILVFIFLASSVVLFWKINDGYSLEIPDFGGSLNEGMIGVPRFINPLLAVSDTDRDLIQLLYSGLVDTDGKGNLIPVLASRYETSKDDLSWTFFINRKAKWHDGRSITSDDVIFTIKRVRDSSLNSIKRASWEGIEVEKIDDYTVRFWLKIPYASFLENTTLPILPKHIWEKISSEEMSLSNFNIEPVGSGPFEVKKIYRDSSGIISSYKLKANKNFVLGRPFIKYLNLFFFNSEEKLINAYRQGKIDETGFISSSNIKNILKKGDVIKTLTLPRIFAVFFNSANNPIFEEKEVRLALNSAIDRQFIIGQVLNGYGSAIDSPIPPGSIGGLRPEENNLSQEKKTDKARKILERKGWKLNKENIFEKKVRKQTIKLNFNVSTSNVPDLMKTAEILKNIWEQMGAKVNLNIFENSDLNQNVIRKRNYEILLFGEVVGRDPDPFAFWHSSQRNDPGLNIALYANSKVDDLLESARTETDLEKRIKKYKIFQEEIKNDQAAIFLYSPYFVYIVPDFLKGFEIENINVPSERFSTIHKWFIYTRDVWPIFVK